MDDVQETVEETTETSSVEEQTTEPVQEAPVVESNDTEKKDSKTVPYERFKEVNDRLKQLEDMVKRPEPTYEPQHEVADLDPESAAAVERLFQKKLAQERVEDFITREGSKLESDPLLDAAFRKEMLTQQQSGKRIDPDTALKNATALIESRLKITTEKAKDEAVTEAKDAALKKEQLGAVGESGKQPEVDPSKLSAAELAKYLNIPRVD